MHHTNCFYGQKFKYLFTEKRSRQKIYNQSRILRSNTNNSTKANQLSKSDKESLKSENITNEETSFDDIQSQLHLESLITLNEYESANCDLNDLFFENEELYFSYSEDLLFQENVQNTNQEVLEDSAFFLTMFFSAKFS